MTCKPTEFQLQQPWSAHYDNEAGPDWDWFISIPGGEPIMGMPEALAKHIVDVHNEKLEKSCLTERP